MARCIASRKFCCTSRFSAMHSSLPCRPCTGKPLMSASALDATPNAARISSNLPVFTSPPDAGHSSAASGGWPVAGHAAGEKRAGTCCAPGSALSPLAYHAPPREFFRERHAGVRRAGGGQADEAQLGKPGGDLRQHTPPEYFFGLAAVEEDSPDLRMPAKEVAKVIGLGRHMHDRAVETAGPLRAGQHVPQRNAIAREQLRALRVGQACLRLEDFRHQLPEGVLRMGVVLLHLE